MKILFEPTSIRDAVRAIFSSPSAGRRVAAVAFIGPAALDLLPDVRDLEVLCWPSPGATSGTAIRKLMAAGANVSFVDGLHSKIYWTEHHGAVVGSANLSRNAFISGTHEFCVQVSPEENFSIDEFISKLNRRAPTTAELEELERLDGLLSAQRRRIAPSSEPAELSSASQVTFLDWFEESLPRPWRFSPWNDEFDEEESEELETLSIELFGRDAEERLQVFPGTMTPGTWLLVFKWNDGVTISRESIEWMFVDHLIPASDPGDDDIAIQLDPISDYDEPPFEIDSYFRDALADVAENRSWDRSVRKSGEATQAFMKSLAKEYGRRSKG